MGQSVTVRNFAGGFLGGALGILASWHIAYWALPIGVLLGVVFGWWHREFIGLFGQAHQHAKRTRSYMCGFTEHVLSAVARFCGLPAWFAKAASRVAAAIKGCFLALAPERFRRWLAAHPMNRARIIHDVLLVLYVLGIPIVMGFILARYGLSHDGVWSLAPLSGCIFAGGWIMYQSHGILKTGSEEIGDLNRYYREWEVISRYGSAGFFFYLLWKFTRYSLGVALFLAVAASWFVICMIFGFFGIMFLWAALSAIYGFYRLSVRSGHQLCLGMTLVVTGASWYFCRSDFSDPRILWSVALGTGILSGVATELARRIILTFCANTAFGQRLASSSEAGNDIIFDEGGCLDVLVVKIGGFWFQQSSVARAYRTVCFSAPHARPIRISG